MTAWLEPKKPDCARRRVKDDPVVVCHGAVEDRIVEVLWTGGAADGAVVLRAGE